MSRYYDDELYHHGIKGQSWGAQNGPPYPLNAQGKAKFKEKLKARMKDAKSGVESAKKRISEASKVHKENKAARKADKVEKKAIKDQERHADSLRKLTNSPTELYKNRHAFTTEELQHALKRIQTEQKLHEMSMKEMNRGKEVLDTIVGYGKTAHDAYTTINNLKGDASAIKKALSSKKDSDSSSDSNSNSNSSFSSSSSSSSSSGSGNAHGIKAQKTATKPKRANAMTALKNGMLLGKSASYRSNKISERDTVEERRRQEAIARNRRNRQRYGY